MADLSVNSQAPAEHITAAQALARRSLQNALDPGQMEQDSRGPLDEGFTEIGRTPGISDQEKAMAELGKAFKSSIPARYPASMAMLTLMSHLAAAPVLTGPLGLVVGKECIAVGREVARYFDGMPAAADIYDTGFAVVAGSPGASDAEKTVARFGSEVAKTSLSLKDRFMAAHEVMTELTRPEASLTGGRLSDLALRTALKVENSQDSLHILNAGFDALLGAGGVTADHKALALFGAAFARSTQDSYVASAGKLIIMDAIASNIPGTMGAVVSTAALNIIDCALPLSDESPLVNTGEAEVQKEMLDNAFTLIAESPHSTEDEKKLAAGGLAIGSDRGGRKDSVLAAEKFLVMKKISELGASSSAKEMNSACDGDLIIGDGVLELDGLKIERRED